MRCARSMETTMRDSAISLTVLVFGTSTSMPDCRMGAVIIKITSRTSMTSTKGTILISEREVPVWRASCGIFDFFQRENKSLTQRTPSKPRTQSQIGIVFSSLSLCAKAFRIYSKLLKSSPALARIHFFNDRRNFQREAVHARAEISDVMQKVVVGNHGGNGGEEPCRRRDQRFGDAGRDGAKACGSGRAQARERVHDAPHGAEKSDERRDRSRRGQPWHIGFHSADFLARGQLHADGYRVEACDSAVGGGAADLAFDFAIPRAINGFKW